MRRPEILLLAMFRTKKKAQQQTLWVPTSEIVETPVNRFYDRLDRELEKAGFHDTVRALCRPHYHDSDSGRPGIDPVVYFKMLMVGFFEGIASERAIAERCADSLSIRHFLRYELTEATPHHSSMTRIRQRLPEEVYGEVFALILAALKKAKLVKGKKLGVDASVIEANASMRTLTHRLTGDAYRDYVKQLAEAAGVDSGDEAAVTRFDKKRKKRVSNDDFTHPHDPDAKVGRTKKGQTRMTYKPEHTVDLETGAIVDVDIRPGDEHDTADLAERVIEAEERMNLSLGLDKDEATIEMLVADKGYYKTDELAALQEAGIKTVIPEQAGRRNLDRLCKTHRKAVHAARRSVKAKYGRALQRKRGELIERSFQHVLDCGGARRTTLRGRDNVIKRYLIQAACANLSLLMRKLCGIGTPKQALAAAVSLLTAFFGLLGHLIRPETPISAHYGRATCSKAYCWVNHRHYLQLTYTGQ
jgi:transposase